MPSRARVVHPWLHAPRRSDSSIAVDEEASRESVCLSRESGQPFALLGEPAGARCHPDASPRTVVDGVDSNARQGVEALAKRRGSIEKRCCTGTHLNGQSRLANSSISQHHQLVDHHLPARSTHVGQVRLIDPVVDRFAADQVMSLALLLRPRDTLIRADACESWQAGKGSGSPVVQAFEYQGARQQLSDCLHARGRRAGQNGVSHNGADQDMSSSGGRGGRTASGTQYGRHFVADS